MSLDFNEPSSIAERLLRLLMQAPNEFFHLSFIRQHIRAKPESIRSTLYRLRDAGIVEHQDGGFFRVRLMERVQVVREFHFMWVPVARNPREKKRYRTKANYTEFQLKGIATKPDNMTIEQAKAWLKKKVLKYRVQAKLQDAPNHLIDVHHARYIDTDNVAESWVKETEQVPPEIAPELQIALWHDMDKFMQSQGLVVIYEP